jgi:Domain of unknown function (DUF5710)
MSERYWLDVPYSEKDEAKALGARWDADERRWYAPRADMGGLERWAALPDLPILLPGEDRSFGSGLFVDLVPASCWFTNVRSCIGERDWERVRRMVIERAEHRCEVCGRIDHGLHVHERWSYDDERQVQSLRRLISLCPGCHETTHMGLANVRGRAAQARAHLLAVAGMSEAEADEHIEAAFALWDRRSASEWTLEIGMLEQAGIEVRRPPDADERADVARRTLVARRDKDRRKQSASSTRTDGPTRAPVRRPGRLTVE